VKSEEIQKPGANIIFLSLSRFGKIS